jgi:hypothetical protein
MSMIQCDFIKIELTEAAQHLWAENKGGRTHTAALLHALEILPCVLLATHDEVAVPLTMSVNQLHVGENYFITSSQKFTFKL